MSAYLDFFVDLRDEAGQVAQRVHRELGRLHLAEFDDCRPQMAHGERRHALLGDLTESREVVLASGAEDRLKSHRRLLVENRDV